MHLTFYTFYLTNMCSDVYNKNLAIIKLISIHKIKYTINLIIL